MTIRETLILVSTMLYGIEQWMMTHFTWKWNRLEKKKKKKLKCRKKGGKKEGAKWVSQAVFVVSLA